MKEKSFYDWAMDELKLAREEAMRIRKVQGITDVETAISKHRAEIIDLAEKIINMIVHSNRGPIESYSAINMVKTLLDREPLTPVTDESDQWMTSYIEPVSEAVTFQHKRNYSLFRSYDKNGKMRITDVDRVRYANVREDDTDFSYSNGYLTRLIDTVYHPITFPYTSEEIRVKIDRLDGDEIREDLPTIVEVISYSVNNGPFEKIGRYYRYNAKTNKWDEISPFVYVNHKNVIEMTRKIYDEYDAVKKGCPCCED